MTANILTELLGFDPNQAPVSVMAVDQPTPVNTTRNPADYVIAPKITARYGDYEAVQISPNRFLAQRRPGLGERTLLRNFSSRQRAIKWVRDEFLADGGEEPSAQWKQSDWLKADPSTGTTKKNRRCTGTTKKGQRCKLGVKKGQETCKVHARKA